MGLNVARRFELVCCKVGGIIKPTLSDFAMVTRHTASPLFCMEMGRQSQDPDAAT